MLRPVRLQRRISSVTQRARTLRGFRIIGERALRIVPSELRAGIDQLRFQTEGGQALKGDCDVAGIDLNAITDAAKLVRCDKSRT